LINMVSLAHMFPTGTALVWRAFTAQDTHGYEERSMSWIRSIPRLGCLFVGMAAHNCLDLTIALIS
jgi:hypothetical protein